MKFIMYNDTIISSSTLQPTQYLFNSSIAHKALHTNFEKGLVYKALKNPEIVFLLEDDKENILKIFTAILELKNHSNRKKPSKNYQGSVQYLNNIKYRDKRASFLSKVLTLDKCSIARVKMADPFGFAYLQQLLDKHSLLLEHLEEVNEYFRTNRNVTYKRPLDVKEATQLGKEKNKYTNLACFHQNFCMYREAAIDYSFIQNEYAKMIDCMKNNKCNEIINISETFYPEVKLWNQFVKGENITITKNNRKQFTTKNQKEIYEYLVKMLKQPQNKP